MEDGRVRVEFTMEKNAVLLVEPTSGQIQHTRLPWDAAAVSVSNSPRAGLTAALTFRPAIILLSLQQAQSTGLHLARAIRRRLGSEPIIVVYGRPTPAQRRALARQRDQIRSKWGVDRLLASDPTGSRLGEVVADIQQARIRRDGTLAIPTAPTPTEPARAEPAAPAAPPPPPVSRHELRQVMRAAAASVSARPAEPTPSIPARLLAGLRSLFQRPAA